MVATLGPIPASPSYWAGGPRSRALAPAMGSAYQPLSLRVFWLVVAPVAPPRAAWFIVNSPPLGVWRAITRLSIYLSGVIEHEQPSATCATLQSLPAEAPGTPRDK